MESIAPNIFVSDMDKTIAFYQTLGFELVSRVPDDSQADMVWAMMRSDNVTFMFQHFDSLQNELPQILRSDGGSLLLYIRVKDIRKLFERLNGSVEVIKGLEETFYGATEFSVRDVNNYVLTFAEHEK